MKTAILPLPISGRLALLRCGLAALVLSTNFVAVHSANAQANENDRQQQRQERTAKSRQAKLLTESTARIIIKAQEALEEKQFDEALESLNSLLAKSDRLNDYDKARALQFVAYVYLSQDKYQQAIEYSERALALDALDETSRLELNYSLATLHLFNENFTKSAGYLETWLAGVDEPGAQALFLAAQVYALLEQYDKAQNFASKGMSKHYADPEFAPNQEWHRLQLAVLLNLKRYESAIPLLQAMIVYWPDQYQYYQQLAVLLQERNNEQGSLAVVSIAYQNRLFDGGDDMERLLQLYRLQNYPAKGAEIYQRQLAAKRIENSAQQLEALSNAWLQAREWSLANNYLVKAAEKSDDGRNWLLLCQTSAQDEHWQQSIDYCRRAIDKGGLEQESGTAWQLIALANYHQNKLDEAVAAFERCVSWSLTRDDCRNWQHSIAEKIAFNEQERRRLEQEEKAQQRRQQERLELIRNL